MLFLSVFGSVSDSNLRRDISVSLRNKDKTRAMLGKASERMSVALNRHTKAVNSLHWSPSHGNLMFSRKADIIILFPFSCHIYIYIFGSYDYFLAWDFILLLIYRMIVFRFLF